MLAPSLSVRAISAQWGSSRDACSTTGPVKSRTLAGRTRKLEQRLGEASEKIRHLEPKSLIRQLDVAQDQILTAAKLTALQLILWVLRNYLTALPMTPETFVSRVFALQGRKEIEPTVERVVFYENPRDPEVTAALKDACDRLNQRKLRRQDRLLLYSVEAPPKAG